MKHFTIRVGQRLIARDGTRGYVALNSLGKTLYGPGEPFQIEWLSDNPRKRAVPEVEDSQECTLEQLDAEGITRGRGRMRWAS